MGIHIQRALLIGGEGIVRQQLLSALTARSAVGEVRCLERYPSSDELARIIQLFPADAVFLGVDSVPGAMRVVEELEAQASGTPIVAFNRFQDPRAMVDLMRAGVREAVKPPFDPEVIDEVLARVAVAAANRGAPALHLNLCAFLPARAGVGTSTLACHLSRALTDEAAERILLADFDLVSSPVRYLLNTNQGLTMRDAVELLDCMDVWRWQQTVAHLGGLDVLAAGRLNPRRPLRTGTVRRLLAFAAPQYEIVCADLSGNMESFSLEVLRSAGSICMVTTADRLSLGAARDKADFLESLGLRQRAALLVRQDPGIKVPSIRDLESFCGLPVLGVFDYSADRSRYAQVGEDEIRLPSALQKQLTRCARGLIGKVDADVGTQGMARTSMRLAASYT
ncbi:MAG: hypothetical protein ABI823_02925 [Bryobacteraceae bacterium]